MMKMTIEGSIVDGLGQGLLLDYQLSGEGAVQNVSSVVNAFNVEQIGDC